VKDSALFSCILTVLCYNRRVRQTTKPTGENKMKNEITNLTENQIKLILNICTSEFCFDNHPLEKVIWTFSALRGIPEHSRGGIVSNAIKADLISIDDYDSDPDEHTICLTGKGWNAICDHYNLEKDISAVQSFETFQQLQSQT